MKKFSFSATGLIFSCFFILLACSAQQVGPINVDADGVALKGYDPVAYFILGRPHKGQKEFHYEWGNGTWLFSGREHLQMFQQDPEKYAPQYGGY